ncbi:alpha/beta fold hydrolase [Amycolatopsis sp. OK19-0408]|uniref:Alpha/beta fold hydrolase n=1 Tax=Amycolatopsis iheyensis TaxID=2945988 RepID=A0A9X2SKH0_9PSEU|nr:alpha/beta fold hydrolase [Amycolatopsis iheyensis]MCR6483370.1 alpha/beta fold hydrolase [Amycolatopsis iheyensis]
MRPCFPYGEPSARARVRLFCLPYAGGAASSYHPWWQHRDGAVDVVPIQLPGRENRVGEDPATDLHALVDSLVDVVAGYEPFALFGHSMGALIAYELAGRTAPERLFVSGSVAPGTLTGTGTTYRWPRHEVIAELRRLNGTPAAVLDDDDLLNLLLPRLRADWQVADTYRPSTARVAAPISAFGGTSDPDVPLAGLLAWRKHAEDVRTRVLPGDHFFVDRHTRTLVDLVRADLGMS